MRYELDRETVQASVRAAALVFVVAWLFSDDLRAWIPVWLPIAVLLAAEVEFVLRGRRERAGRAARRVTPGPEDADLGFGELVEDEDGIRFVPPPARPVRARRRVAWFVGGVLAAAVVALAVRSDRAATWQALSSETRARAEARFTSEAAAIAGAAARVRCDDGYSFTGAGSDTLGVAFPNAGLAYLDPTICRRLYDLAFRGTGERRADDRCGDRPGTRGGAPRRRAPRGRHGVPRAPGRGAARRAARPRRGRTRRLLDGAFDQRLAERNVIRAAYALPSSCRDGGALDRRPGDSRFPF